MAVPSLSFVIDGDTLSSDFSFTNTSDAGETLLRFYIDISGVFPVVDFDTTNDPRPGGTLDNFGTPFAALNGSDIATGLSGVIADDNTQFVDLSFSDFDPLETFEFEVDVDPIDLTLDSTITGDELIGATAFADFSDG